MIILYKKKKSKQKRFAQAPNESVLCYISADSGDIDFTKHFAPACDAIIKRWSSAERAPFRRFRTSAP